MIWLDEKADIPVYLMKSNRFLVAGMQTSTRSTEAIIIVSTRPFVPLLFKSSTVGSKIKKQTLQVKVPGSSPSRDSQSFLQTFPICIFSPNQ